MPGDVSAYNKQLIAQFRETGGGDRPLLLLTTVGARSGAAHTTPMMYVPDDERLLVVASNAGAARHPDWFVNSVANPRVTVEVRDSVYPASAIVLEGSDRDAVFARIAAQYPFFLEHQQKTSRVIPVVALVRLA